MISAQSHRQRLSGNSLTLLFVVTGFLISSCAMFGPAKKSEAEPDDDIVKGVPDEDKSKVDTVVWTEKSETEFPPIESRSSKLLGVHKDSYNIVLLAPFGADDLQYESARPSARMTKMIEFLAGVEYALDKDTGQAVVHLQVIDTDGPGDFSSRFQDLPEMQEADIIVGPYYSDLLNKVSDFALENQKLLVSPWNTGTLKQANPLYVQLRPSLEVHAKKISKYVTSMYGEDEVVLMTKDEPRAIETLGYFQKPSEMGEHPIRELIIDDISNSELTDSLALYISEQGLRRFILPVWHDAPFVIAALSKLNYAKGEEDISVFGLPQWMTMSAMDYDYFENLKVHVSSERPVSYESEHAVGLRNYYFEKYGDLPSDEAYYGMDIMKWLSSLLKSEGLNITTGFDKIVPGVDQKFDFISVFGEDGERVDHFENQHVDIIQFRDYKFESIN